MENFVSLTEVELHEIEGGRWSWKKIAKVAFAVIKTATTIASGGAVIPAVIKGAITIIPEL
ncbi:Blp family class II bacteriocin [Clostridium cellulovorans]|uniref:Bacteriocin class II, amylovorin-like n=1 Tax=Clostridium cellulovorans (strain ATCC 35296 / DSM 3052 / OCM 3 / 743B) TaxID=573061 RepID=D9SR35_CLOC7|nr:Blp family class II bacteriocin [Clostridium cellulovorans]ADL50323.1 Bacteriocin class II, amylovorin-like [Clostridium cellulovorans 743B]